MTHRSLRRYEGRRVFVTLDKDAGVRGVLHRAYRDHLLIVDAQGAAAGENGELVLEPETGAVDAVPTARVLRIRLERE
jgi:hypothetical protein